jgi:hypothetical protein
MPPAKNTTRRAFSVPPSWQCRRIHAGFFEEMKTVTGRFHGPGEVVTSLACESSRQPNRGGRADVYYPRARPVPRHGAYWVQRWQARSWSRPTDRTTTRLR